MVNVAKKEAELIKKILEDHKVEDVSLIDVSKMSPFASYYVLATCINVTSLDAIPDILEEELEKENLHVSLRQGNANSGWVIVQVEDVLVHLFLAANRREINLEELITKYVNLLK